jgi:hypothetical protein
MQAGLQVDTRRIRARFDYIKNTEPRHAYPPLSNGPDPDRCNDELAHPNGRSPQAVSSARMDADSDPLIKSQPLGRQPKLITINMS